MKNQKLRVCVSREPKLDGVVSCRTISLREKVLTRLFGQKQRVTVLIPGNDVTSVSIHEESEGGATNG